MSKPILYDDLNVPFTEKSSAKMIGKLNQSKNTQAAAVTLAATDAAAVLWHASFTGAIYDLFILLDADPGAAETMVYDVKKNGTSILTGTLTVDDTFDSTKQISLRDLGKIDDVNFEVGDVFTVDRVYTAGAGLVEYNTVVIEPSLSQG